MLDWFTEQTLMMQIFWGCAIIGTAFFAVQLVLMLIGIDSDVTDIDFDAGDTLDLGGGLSMFSIKSLVNFIVGFGWGGVCLASTIQNKVALIFAALVVGAFFSWMYLFLYKKMRRLEHNGAFNIDACVGKTATVYLRIPANNEGHGKIQISINGSIHEFDAVTNGDALPSGRKVTVLSVVDSSTLKVK